MRISRANFTDLGLALRIQTIYLAVDIVVATDSCEQLRSQFSSKFKLTLLEQIHTRKENDVADSRTLKELLGLVIEKEETVAEKS